MEKGVKDLWKLMNISYDRFIRTTDSYHVSAIQKIFKEMYEKGDIYKGTYEGMYCTPCESFWTASQLKDGKCPDCGREVQPAQEEAYFFRLSKYAGAVRDLLVNTDFLEPRSRVNEMVNNFIDPGLEDLCVSRTSFTWGIPVDFDPGHVVYVWVDALFNYLTALGFRNDRYEDYDKYWPADVHFVGKEIVRFHSIVWPAMLMSMGLPLPKKVFGHGWLLLDGKVYLTDSGYNQNGAKNYTFEGMLDGEYSFLEVLSRKGTGNVFPDSWTITVTDTAGKTVYDKTFIAADFITDDNGDYRLNKISVTGLTGGGNMTMTIHNAPVPADLEILKTSEDGKVSGITFTVEEWAPGIGYCRIGRYTTDESGKILVPKLYVGTKYRLTETVPEGYIGEAPKEITIQAGTNTVTFENRPIYGNLELTKIDESNPEIKLSGAEFTVTREISSEDPSLGSAIREQVMPEVLDADGHGTGVYRLEHLRYGRYTIRETKAPEGYELSNEVFTIDITEDGKTYTVSSSGFDGVPNRQQVGSVQVKKVDPEGNPLAGVSFLLEYSQDGKNWKSVTFREEGSLPTLGGCTSAGLTDGVLVTGEDGTALFSGLCISIGDNHTYYRLTETAAPEGYSLLAKPAFEGELPQDGSRDITVTAVNSSQYMLPFTGNI